MRRSPDIERALASRRHTRYFAGVDRERTLESRELLSTHMSGDRIVAGNRLARSLRGVERVRTA